MASVALHPAIEAQRDLVPIPDIDESILATLRSTPLAAPVELSDKIERTDHVVSADPKVLVRAHRPKNASGALPCVYSIHGGGYILGTYEMDDARFDRYCTHFPCVGVSVDGRRSPDTTLPSRSTTTTSAGVMSS